jgi:hypothetical protein
MISKSEVSMQDIQNILRGLVKSVNTCESLTSQEKHSMVRSIVFQLNTFDQVAAGILARKVQEKIGIENVGEANRAKYPGQIDFDGLMKSGKLFVINNTQKPGSAYLYFDESFIADFDKLNEVSQDKFMRLVSDGTTKFAAAKNEQGIKYLGHNNNLPRCRLNLENGHYDATITYEIKINGSEDRIGVLLVKPLDNGSDLLVATHSIKGGLHNKKHNGKELSTKKLSIAYPGSPDRRTMLDKVVFFPSANTSRRDSEEPIERLSNEGPIKAR